MRHPPRARVAALCAGRPLIYRSLRSTCWRSSPVQKISIRAGDTYHDLEQVCVLELEEPSGWITVPLELSMDQTCYTPHPAGGWVRGCVRGRCLPSCCSRLPCSRTALPAIVYAAPSSAPRCKLHSWAMRTPPPDFFGTPVVSHFAPSPPPAPPASFAATVPFVLCSPRWSATTVMFAVPPALHVSCSPPPCLLRPSPCCFVAPQSLDNMLKPSLLPPPTTMTTTTTTADHEPLRAHLVQVSIDSMHQNGRDTHIRLIKARAIHARAASRTAGRIHPRPLRSSCLTSLSPTRSTMNPPWDPGPRPFSPSIHPRISTIHAPTANSA
jgi:hypothetical protein